jgi:DNA-binding NarL/FixJ family response regulator
MARVRVILADDHRDFLACTAGMLAPEFDVVETVADGQALIEAADRLDPDVLVTDISMPGISGIEAARVLKAAGSRAKIVVLTVHQDQDFVNAALAAGVDGYVVKRQLAFDLQHALHEVLAGRNFVSSP